MRFFSSSESCSDFSIEVVPTSTGWPRLAAFLDQLDDRFVLLVGGAIDLVVVVHALDRHVGRDVHDVELVDVHEFGGFGHGRAGHAGQLVVEAEIVLEGDRGRA